MALPPHLMCALPGPASGWLPTGNCAADDISAALDKTEHGACGRADSSGSRTAKIRHRVAKNAVNCGALAAREALLQCSEPLAHRLERRTNWPGGHDPLDTDRRGRLLARKQDFMQPLTGPNANELDLDIATRLEAGQADHPFRKIDDFHRLAHIENVDGDIRAVGPERVARRHDDQIAGLPDGHKVAHHL